MKIVVLIGGGRSGIDFLQSLLDSHPAISQFPGVFYFDEFWPYVKNKKNPEDIIDYFLEKNKKFFDSRLNIMERHYMLGKNKDSFYLIDQELFKKKFINFFDEKKFDKINLLKWLHLSYSSTSHENIDQKKIIILHLHHVSRIKVLDGLDFECIYTIRDPLASYTSLMKHWLSFGGSKNVTPSTYFFHMNRMFNGLKDTINIQQKTHVVKLENLHIDNVKVMRDLSNKLDISYNPAMTQSTYHGKLWWGDKVSGKDLNGVNPNFKNYVDEKLFFKKDIQCIESYLKPFILKYEYSFRSKGLRNNLIKFLPFKFELIIWFRTIVSMNIKEIILIAILWYRRVKLMDKNNYKFVKFPTHVGF